MLFASILEDFLFCLLGYYLDFLDGWACFLQSLLHYSHLHRCLRASFSSTLAAQGGIYLL